MENEAQMENGTRMEDGAQMEDGAFKRTIAGCRVVGLLGRGAFARVYLVENERGKQSACKLCDNIALLRQEAEIHRAVRHPLFPEYLDFQQEEGTGYLLMEYAKGINLDDFLRRGGRLTEQEAVGIAVQLAEGLRYLHGQPTGILFRDIKPGNIIFMEDGSVKLVDFGCACPMGDNPGVAGTPGYAAPEQLRFGGRLAPNCDVYSLGSTLRAMVGKKCTRRLKKVMEAFTREEPCRRPPDMDWALELLASCRRPAEAGSAVGRRGSLTDMQRALLKGEVLFQRWYVVPERRGFSDLPKKSNA